MFFVELGCVACAGVYLLSRRLAGALGRRAAWRLVALAAVAWLVEDLSIRVFGLHGYSDGWTWSKTPKRSNFPFNPSRMCSAITAY